MFAYMSVYLISVHSFSMIPAFHAGFIYCWGVGGLIFGSMPGPMTSLKPLIDALAIAEILPGLGCRVRQNCCTWTLWQTTVLAVVAKGLESAGFISNFRYIAQGQGVRCKPSTLHLKP